MTTQSTANGKMKSHMKLLVLGFLACSTSIQARANDGVRPRAKGAVPMVPPAAKAGLRQLKTQKTVAPPVRSDSAPKRAYNWYLHKCAEDPLVTKSISAAVINLFGDVLAQNFEAFLSGENVVLNVKRMTTFFLCGLLYVGPFVHYWYDLLFRLGNTVQKKYKFSKVKVLLTQVLTDQSLGVALYFPSYFYVFEFLEALVLQRTPSLDRATKKCLGQLSAVLGMQYRIFPITNAFNLAVIPPELRVLFSNAVSIFWNMYLCTLLAK